MEVKVFGVLTVFLLLRYFSNETTTKGFQTGDQQPYRRKKPLRDKPLVWFAGDEREDHGPAGQ